MFSYMSQSLWLMIVFGLLSIAVMVYSANGAVLKLTGLAGYFRLSTTFVAVTFFSIATRIPELAAHFTASFGVLSGSLDYKVSSSVVLVANIGSDVVQQTLIMAIGGGALISTYYVPRPLVYWDLPWETITGAILWIVLYFNNGKLGKWVAYYLIALYFVYITMRMIFFAVD